MRITHLPVTLVLTYLLAACTAPTANPAGRDAAAAQATLEQFLDPMRRGDYQGAAALYGGSYETLRDWNPGIAPDDRAALFESGCRVNGLRCLAPASITPGGMGPNGEFLFTVTFVFPDGRRLVIDIPGSDQPPRSQFTFRVVRGPNGFQVLDLPPYVS